jgi:hypothetical protein
MVRRCPDAPHRLAREDELLGGGWMDGDGAVEVTLGRTAGDGHRQALHDLGCVGAEQWMPTTRSSSPSTTSFMYVRAEPPAKAVFIGRKSDS